MESAGNPCSSCQPPGIERMKLRVERNIAVAPRLPSAEAFGESGLAAISAPITIPVIPMSPASFRMTSILLIREKSGLVETAFAGTGRPAREHDG